MTRNVLLGVATLVGVAAVALLVAHGLRAPEDAIAQDGAADLRLEDAFPGVTFQRPIFATQPPDGTNRMFVAQQRGLIRIVEHPAPAPPGTADVRTFLDLSARVAQTGNERGLLGLAFHPGYAQNGRLFVHYSGTSGQTVLAEYTVSSTGPDVGDFDSERILLTRPQPYSNHNGGMIAFGPDGMLYMALGDGGSAGDPEEAGQDLGTWLGKILRIDVDGQDAGLEYAVPADNPFVERSGALPEIWAYGLRNPWRFSFDRETGELYCGDVGQNRFEEVDRIEKGGNYGWDRREGFSAYADSGPPEGPLADPLRDPLAVYARGAGVSVTGGYVYRGTASPALVGTYLYADYVSGTIWGLTHDDGANVETVVLLNSDESIASFAEDRDGELYVCSFASGGRVLRLVSDAPLPPPEALPPTLSETGLFTDLPRLVPADGAHAYGVRAALWSDGAAKSRFVLLPPGAALGFHVEDAFDLPAGGWAVKTFSLPLGRRKHRRLETRVILRTEDALEMGTYRWRASLEDADLVEDREVETVARRGGDVEWTYPSRADCRSCHTEAAGHLLGLTARQVKHPRRRRPDLLRRWSRAGVLAGSLPPFRAIARNLPLRGVRRAEQRARSYLDANCSFCHRPGAPQPAGLDLRATTPLLDTGAFDTVPTRGDFGIEDARLIHPRAPAKSVLLARMRLRGDEKQMPPLGSAIEDLRAVRVLARWIRRLR